MSAQIYPVFDIEEAEIQKSQIIKAIKPVSGTIGLPKKIGDSKKVLLIVPPATREEHFGRLSAASGELPMLGLAYIAAALVEMGHEVKVIDYEVNTWPMSKVEKDLIDFSPDLVGMTAYITNMRRCADVAEIVKKVSQKTLVVLGGPQVTIFPEEAFNSPFIDMVVLSEGELIICNVMNSLGDENKLKQVKGIWYRGSDGEIIKNEREILVDNLDIFNKPALHLYEMHKYFPPVYIRGKKVAHLLTSRGCPFKSTFCETKLTFGRSFRYHSTDRILEELSGLIAEGYDGFQFYDDIFTANKNRVEELCTGIINKGWRIQWMCYTRTNTLSPELLKLMKKAGCYMISFGIETADDDLLNVISKGLDVNKNIEGIKLTKQAGIQVTGTFMLGLPTETAEQTRKTIEFALQNDIDYAVFGITEPFPGTELWVDAKKYGTFDYSGKYRNALLSENAAVWVPNGRTRDELKNFVDDAMWKFYMRPKSLLLAFKNFFIMPFGRSVRYLWSGIIFFVWGRINKSHAAHRN